MLSLLASFFLTSALATSRVEWIAEKTTRAPWDALKSPASAEFVRAFGPGQRYGLFRTTTPLPALPIGFRWRQPNYRYRALDAADPDFEKSWALQNTGQTPPGGETGIPGKDIGAVEAWNLHTGDGSVIVAIIDSGIELEHEDLRANLWVNPGEIAGNHIDDDGNGFIDDINGWNFVAGNNDVQDQQHHGTFCAGLVGAEAGNLKGARGVIPHVRLMALKFLDEQGNGTTERAVSAFHYAIRNGARLLNASWGGPTEDPVLEEAVRWVGEQGALLIAAAGNDAKNNDTDAHPTVPASYALPAVISVAAYDNRDGLATFSSYGKRTVHVGAPGVAVYSTSDGSYRYADGTSFAAPLVTGVAALLKSYLPALDAQAIKERLLATTEPLGYYDLQKSQTGGRIHAGNALVDRRPLRPPVPSHWDRYSTTLETPHPYPLQTTQRYTVRSPGATHVRVHFTNFETEKCCDRVVVRDGQGVKVTDYVGSLGAFWSVDVLGEELNLDFTSDYSVNAYGFAVDAYEASGD